MLRYLIKEAENGWTLTKHNPWEEEHLKVKVEVFEQGLSRKEECEALQRLLNALAEELLPYDKWSEHNVTIKIQAGHKVERETPDEDTHA